MMAHLYDQLGEALKAQRARFGEDAFVNRRRLLSLLFDEMPEARREIRALSAALDEGAIDALLGVERSLLGMEMDRQADRLEQAVGLRADLARHTIRALAYALELGPAPSVYESAPVSPTPSPSQSAWAGLSQPIAPAPSYSATAISPPAPAPSAPPMHAHAPHAPYAPPGPQGGLNTVLFTAMGRQITRMHALAAAGVVGAVVLFAPMISQQGPMDVAGGGGGGGADVQSQGYAGELADLGVAPKETLESNVGSPTPLSVPGAQRVTTMELRALLSASSDVLLVDVLADPHQQTIQGARYLPAAGQPGTFNDQAQQQTVRTLSTLTENRRDRPIVFFCAGSSCWESYNAVLRAHTAGYTRLYWYRGGLASWHAAGLPFQPLPPAGQ